MSQPDRESVTLEFKLSKNYNSVGGSVSFSSDKRDGEDNEALYQRLYKEVEDKIDRLISKAKSVLDK